MQWISLSGACPFITENNSSKWYITKHLFSGFWPTNQLLAPQINCCPRPSASGNSSSSGPTDQLLPSNQVNNCILLPAYPEIAKLSWNSKKKRNFNSYRALGNNTKWDQNTEKARKSPAEGCHYDSYFFGYDLELWPLSLKYIGISLSPISNMYKIWKLYVEKKNYSSYRVRTNLYDKNVKYKRTDELSMAPTIEHHGGHSRTRGETRCPGGVSVSCLASAPAMNARDTTKVYTSIWRLDTGCGPTLYRKCHSHNTPGKKGFCDAGLLTFDPKMYRYLPITILYYVLNMKAFRWNLLKVSCPNQSVDKVYLWPGPLTFCSQSV